MRHDQSREGFSTAGPNGFATNGFGVTDTRAPKGFAAIAIGLAR